VTDCFNSLRRKREASSPLPESSDLTNNSHFQSVFGQLKHILQEYEQNLVVHTDRPGDYVLYTPFAEAHKKEVFFGSVKIQKSYVSFQLMPVYVFPDLLEGISPKLRARMQGKSCFNFKTIEPSQVKELAQLCKRGVDRFKKGKLLG
jgi:hypothetical protein